MSTLMEVISVCFMRWTCSGRMECEEDILSFSTVCKEGDDDDANEEDEDEDEDKDKRSAFIRVIAAWKKTCDRVEAEILGDSPKDIVKLTSSSGNSSSDKA